MAWSVLAIAFGLLNVPAIGVVQGEQESGYCESVDHPDPCENLLPWFFYALTAIAGGSWSLAAGIGFLRKRPRARHRLVVALVTWTTALLALGALAVAVELGPGPLVGIGVALLVLALINAAVCILAAVLVSRPAAAASRTS